MGRKSTTGGVSPSGPCRIQFDFTIDGKRYRPTLQRTPHETNLRRARELLSRIKARIAAGRYFTRPPPHWRGVVDRMLEIGHESPREGVNTLSHT